MKIYNPQKSHLLGYHVFEDEPSYKNSNNKPMALSFKGFLLHVAIAIPVAAVAFAGIVAWAWLNQ